jgi:glycolate oxidase FAD binding subunit
VRQAASAVGGSASIFMAASDSAAGTKHCFSPLTPAVEHIHRRLKAEFDPAGIFNPGRMYPYL